MAGRPRAGRSPASSSSIPRTRKQSPHSSVDYAIGRCDCPKVDGTTESLSGAKRVESESGKETHAVDQGRMRDPEFRRWFQTLPYNTKPYEERLKEIDAWTRDEVSRKIYLLNAPDCPDDLKQSLRASIFQDSRGATKTPPPEEQEASYVRRPKVPYGLKRGLADETRESNANRLLSRRRAGGCDGNRIDCEAVKRTVATSPVQTRTTSRLLRNRPRGQSIGNQTESRLFRDAEVSVPNADLLKRRGRALYDNETKAQLVEDVVRDSAGRWRGNQFYEQQTIQTGRRRGDQFYEQQTIQEGRRRGNQFYEQQTIQAGRRRGDQFYEQQTIQEGRRRGDQFYEQQRRRGYQFYEQRAIQERGGECQLDDLQTTQDISPTGRGGREFYGHQAIQDISLGRRRGFNNTAATQVMEPDSTCKTQGAVLRRSGEQFYNSQAERHVFYDSESGPGNPARVLRRKGGPNLQPRDDFEVGVPNDKPRRRESYYNGRQGVGQLGYEDLDMGILRDKLSSSPEHANRGYSKEEEFRLFNSYGVLVQDLALACQSQRFCNDVLVHDHMVPNVHLENPIRRQNHEISAHRMRDSNNWPYSEKLPPLPNPSTDQAQVPDDGGNVDYVQTRRLPFQPSTQPPLPSSGTNDASSSARGTWHFVYDDSYRMSAPQQTLVESAVEQMPSSTIMSSPPPRSLTPIRHPPQNQTAIGSSSMQIPASSASGHLQLPTEAFSRHVHIHPLFGIVPNAQEQRSRSQPRETYIGSNVNPYPQLERSQSQPRGTSSRDHAILNRPPWQTNFQAKQKAVSRSQGIVRHAADPMHAVPRRLSLPCEGVHEYRPRLSIPTGVGSEGFGEFRPRLSMSTSIGSVSGSRADANTEASSQSSTTYYTSQASSGATTPLSELQAMTTALKHPTESAIPFHHPPLPRDSDTPEYRETLRHEWSLWFKLNFPCPFTTEAETAESSRGVHGRNENTWIASILGYLGSFTGFDRPADASPRITITA